ncbi:efflux RND transporter permease subunit [Panacagrimonas sp.]|uniref:efflux RND transporter permease subunit n=1 Tax=Panacagrimonas sp. TaxID=2480088 RepID=UPI003B51D35F
MSDKDVGLDSGDYQEGPTTTAHRILSAIEPLIFARRKLTMAILVAITAVLFWQMVQIKPDAGFDKSVPLKHPYMQVLKQYMADFGGANTVLVALIQKDGKGEIYNEKFLLNLKEATDEVFFLKGVDRSRVSSLFTPDVRYIEVVEGGFRGGNVIPAEYAPTQEMYDLVKGNVSKGGHVGRYTTIDQTGAMIFSELLEIDPVTGEKLDYGRVANELEDKLRGRFTNPRKFVYKLKEDKGPLKAGDVVADGFVPISDLKLRFLTTFEATYKNEEDRVEIIPVKGSEVTVEEIDNPQYNPDIDVHIIGFAKVVGDVIDATLEVVGFFMLTLVMTGVLLWLYIGHFKLAMLPLICSVTAVIWEFGLLRLLGFGLDPFAILVPFLILAVSVSHGVQFVNAWVGEIAENGRDSFDASLFTWRRLAIYGTMAIMTDVFGFAVIGLIPIDIVREMAINACLGMLAIVVTNKFMMPIFLSWIEVKDIKTFMEKQERRDGIFNPLWYLISGMVKPVPAVTAILVMGALFGWSIWQGKALQVGDSQAGVPELLPDSRYNNDTAAVVANFAIGLDILKVVAETDPEACVKYEVMEQIDRFAWTMDNTYGVQSSLSLPQVAKTVNSAFSEANPRFKVLPRNQYTMVQSITPIPTSSGLLNPNCSAMAVFVFMRDHKATTIERVVDATKDFNRTNGAAFFETHTNVDAAYCEDKLAARRAVGNERHAVQKLIDDLKKGDPEIGETGVNENEKVIAARARVDEANARLAGFDKECPVNFALATANVGVMAATNEEVHRLEKQILLYVYIAIIIAVYLSFFEWQSIFCIMLPLALVSWMAYGVMAVLGIGMKVATLPVVALAVGIGVDYGIYVYATMSDALAGGFKMRDAYYKTLRMTGKAVVFTGITLGFGVATWLWSGLQFQRDMGALLVFMFTGNMFGAILILPAIASFILKEKQLAPGEIAVFKPRH